MTDCLAPLGSRYIEDLRNAYDGRWIDWHPSPGKRSGAYATGWGYDVHPYVLLNYTANYEGVSTLAHEMGHAMHSFFSNRSQPFSTADYSIFVAEVASTVNEVMFFRYLVSQAPDDEAKLANVRRELDLLNATWADAVTPDETIERIHRELKAINEQLWEIEDDGASRVAARFHEGWVDGLSAAEALRRAQVDALRGMDVTITTTARTDDEGRALLRAFNFPLKA